MNGESVMAKIEVLERIVDKLNQKFDTENLFQSSGNRSRKMFEGVYHTCGSGMECWSIKFMNQTVFTGGNSEDDMNECLTDGYVDLNEKNENKIYMLTVGNVIKVIEQFMYCLACADISEKNRTKWISALKKGISEE